MRRVEKMGKPGITLESVKNNNKSEILKMLQKNGAMSRKDIAACMGLTPAAVTMLCNAMIEENIIVEKGEIQEEKRAGRRKVLVDINYDFKFIVSVSIETIYTWITVNNIRGSKITGVKIKTDTTISPEMFLESITKEIKILLWEQEIKISDILGVGVCIPGIVNRSQGVSIHAYGIWKKEVKVKDILGQYIQCPIVVENNVKAFAEGEMLYGVGKTGDNMLFIKWGPGVGSAIVIGNELYEGLHHNAAEIGHYIVEPNGLECRCGRRGCLETRVSVDAIAKRIQQEFSKENTPLLYKLTEGDVKKVTRELIIEWVESVEADNYLNHMDPAVAEIISGAVERIARVAVNTMTILAPDHTILFGPMLENDQIYKLFMEFCRKYDRHYTDEYIHQSELSKKITYIGGTALVARNCFFENGGSVKKE